MRKLDTSAITSGNRMPLKQGSIEFLQESHRETVEQLFDAFISKGYAIFQGYIIWGCNKSISGGNVTISEGAIFFNGEVFLSPQQVFPVPVGSDVVICNIGVSQYTTNADAVTFTDSIARDIHNIRTALFTTGTTATGVIGDYSVLIHIGDWNTLSSVAILPNTGNIVASGTPYKRYKINQKTLYLKFQFNSLTITGSPTSFSITIPESNLYKIKNYNATITDTETGICGMSAQKTLSYTAGVDALGNPDSSKILISKIDGSVFATGNYVTVFLIVELDYV